LKAATLSFQQGDLAAFEDLFDLAVFIVFEQKAGLGKTRFLFITDYHQSDTIHLALYK